MASNQDVEERLRSALADRYTIEGEIGSGGMATVYLAQDLKHDRKVAVKVLKPELAAVVGTERFLAEIRTTANLSHPHILPLHDSGEAGGFLFYVMPYVEGDTLRQRLDRDGQLSVEEAVRIATRVADALDSAHRHGVIHRDLKPANILFQEGEPVVADFGIALAVSAAGEGRLTETGLSLGTPFYMSPEQATGDQTPTAASDVYSLGCVLYEMLTGEPPHTGTSAQAILGKILLADVIRPTKLRRTIPANVEGVVLKALERLPADRFESVAELAAALKDKGFRHGGGVGAAAGPWKGLAIGFGVVAFLALALGITGVVGPKRPAPEVLRQQIYPPGDGAVREWGRYFALAPDGSSMVYRDTTGLESGWQLWVKERGSADGTPLSGTERAQNVVYSPDGEWIAFRQGTNLIARPFQGAGTVELLDRVTSYWPGLSWLADGTIIAEQGFRVLVRISGDGGASRDTIVALPEYGIRWVQDLRGEESALLLGADGFLQVTDFRADTAWVVLDQVARAWYVPTGHLVYVRTDGAVLAAPFDLKTLELGTETFPLFEGVRTGLGWADMVMNQEGTVVFLQGTPGPAPEYEVVWVTREGLVTPIDPEWTFDPGTNNRGIALSPDGTRLAISIQDDDQNLDIWLKELPQGPETRLTFDSAQDVRPRWTPDGLSVTFISDRDSDPLRAAAYSKRATGTEDPVMIMAHEAQLWEVILSPDMEWVLGRTGGSLQTAGGRDVWALQAGADSLPTPLIVTDFDEKAISLSPNGSWFLYESDESGRDEVYVRPFPNVNDDKITVSTGGGVMPRWSNSGSEIFYVDAEDRMTVATVETSPNFRVTSRSTLFDLPEGTLFRRDEQYPLYDVAPQDDRFIMIRGKDVREPEPRMIMIQNFFTELETLVGGGE